MVVGYPDTVNVLKDGILLKADSRTNIFFDGHNFNLVIKNVTPEDSGNYKVLAQNDKNVVEDAIVINVVYVECSFISNYQKLPITIYV